MNGNMAAELARVTREERLREAARYRAAHEARANEGTGALAFARSLLGRSQG